MASNASNTVRIAHFSFTTFCGFLILIEMPNCIKMKMFDLKSLVFQTAFEFSLNKNQLEKHKLPWNHRIIIKEEKLMSMYNANCASA